MTNHTSRTRLIATNGGVRVAITETGSRTAPVTLLYLHGLLADATYFDNLIAELDADAALAGQVRHVALDTRGHGHSQWPHRHARNDIDALAEDLAAVIDNLHGPIILVAHSLGGFVAQAYARNHPRTFADRVRAVVGFSIAGELPEWRALRPFQKAAAPVRRLRGTRLDPINAAAHWLMQHRMRALAGRAKPGRAQLVPSADPVDPRVTADFCASVEQFHLDVDTAATIARTSVRLISGQYDVVVPATQTERVAAATGAHLTVVDGVGHSLPLSNPALAAGFVRAAIDDIATPPTASALPRPLAEVR